MVRAQPTSIAKNELFTRQAQYLVYEKMREEGFMSGSDDVRLTVEIVVPSTQVGRIIGKGGQNVRELQRVTGSLIKLPEQPPSSGSGGGSPQQDQDTTVHIVGPFYSVQVCPKQPPPFLYRLIWSCCFF